MSSEGHRAVTGGRLGAFIPATIRRQKKDPPSNRSTQTQSTLRKTRIPEIEDYKNCGYGKGGCEPLVEQWLPGRPALFCLFTACLINYF